jgi:hypothetical protein
MRAAGPLSVAGAADAVDAPAVFTAFCEDVLDMISTQCGAGRFEAKCILPSLGYTALVRGGAALVSRRR